MSGAVTDTAYLAAAFRAAENRRPHPRLRDPYAQLFDSPVFGALLAAGGDHVVERTRLVDALLAADAAPVVANLGAGFCSRPYRLDLSARALVLEVDDPGVLTVKETVLAGLVPTCPVRRVGLDLRVLAGLAGVLAPLDGVVVLSEGLLPYLPPGDTAALARTLASAAGVGTWITDVVSTASAGAMAGLARSTGAGLALYGLDTLEVFEANGWTAVDYRLLPAAPGYAAPRGARSSRQVVDGVVRFVRNR